MSEIKKLQLENDLQDVELLKNIVDGDAAALDKLFSRYHSRLRRMIELRTSPALAARIEADDVVQETFVHVTNRINDYVREPLLPFYLWIRKIAELKLNEMYRHHFGTQKRDARREIRMSQEQTTAASSVCLANHVVANLTSPSMGAAKAETKALLANAFDELDSDDRDIIALHSFEELSFSECAIVLDVSRSTAGSRYLNAIKRLKSVLESYGLNELPF